MYRWGLILWVLSCFLCFAAEAQNISNEGKEFWAVFPSHDPSGGNNNTPISYAEIRIWVTSKANSRVTVSCRGYSETKNIPANTPVPFNVTRAEAYINHNESNQLLSGRAIHIEVEDGFEKVAVYAHIFAGFRSAASLILPIESLGQKYYSMNYTQAGNGSANFIEIIATEDNTKVLITEKSGTILPVTLTKAGDVYQYMPGGAADLTGVAINIDPASPDNCNKRFAIFSGSTSLSIGNCSNSRDPLFQQLYPTISWGKEYAIVPFVDRLHIIRVLAQENNTTVKFNGQTIVLNQGEYYESPQLMQAGFVLADKRISVAQYALSQACSSAIGSLTLGDPEMVLLNPTEFNIKEVTLFSSTDQQISSRYINVSMKTAATPSFRINGQLPAASWQVLPERPDYSFIQINITGNANQVSHLTASDGFNAMAYGFGSTESYAYSAGTSLAASNYLLIHNESTNVDAANACLGQPSKFKIVLPFQPLKITWQLDNGTPVDHVELQQTEVRATGTFYTYVYGSDIVFDQLETHRMLVKVQMPNQENCLGGEVEYNFTFDVYPIPSSDFTVAAISCADTELQFTDKSSSNIADKPLNKWRWDFGDGNFSNLQSPIHSYSAAGTFTVTLVAGRDDGCMSDVKTRQITVLPKINAAFSAPVNGCINNEIAFGDESVSASGPMVSWRWDFGDGSPNSTEQHPKHTYLATGTFTVSLVASTANGCQSLPFKRDIVINSLPVVDFNLPKVCVGDEIAEFINKSENVDKTTTGLTYLWNFGDVTALAADNVSVQKNGRHKYNTAGSYTVTLTTTNVNGCSFSVSKEFIVNGSQINPLFEVLNKNALCSNRKITIEHKSTIDVGKIIKLRWFIDDVEKLVVEDPEPVAFYELDPPAASSGTPKQIVIKLVAYSGERCIESLTETVTLFPAPLLVFDPITPVCLNSGVFQIHNGRETLGIQQGNPSYSGAGIISADGYFDPERAGIGTHVLTYHFTSAAGCMESITQSITVQPLPQLNVKKDIYLLTGGEARMDVSASGSNLRYKWVPAAGLDRDDVLNPTVKIDEDREYTLTVTTGLGCSTTAKVKVHLVSSINAANAFSPNGDGVNDTWVLKYIETYPNVEVDIFNRYGEKIFSSQGYSIPFDGNYNGKQLPVGTYYYMINPKNGKQIIKGALTLVR